MEKTPFSCVGKIVKTFGFKGGLIAHIESSFSKKFLETEFVFVEIQHERVPFFIMVAEEQCNNNFSMLLEDIDSLEKARKLTGSRLYIAEPEKNKKSRTVGLEDLTGFELIDKNFGKVGKIHQILELPQQLIMQVFCGKKEVLIPFNEKIVEQIDAVSKTVFIQAPGGLIDFYLK
ncbi:MAG TPA: ribosome maturation factor RimM [Bacteroidales bacterium]|nr:ribosome maturation factor RimM [Bacteroidales bacterium]